MNNTLRNAVQQRRQQLIERLLTKGIYKKEDRHLYEWTLSDLEEEYKYIITNNLESSKEKIETGNQVL